MSRRVKQPQEASVEAQIDFEALDIETSFTHGFSISRREIQLIGEIDEHSFRTFDLQLSKLESLSRKPVTIKLDSEGGNSDEAVSIMARMVESPCTIIVKAYGRVQSAASIILAAADRRYMSKFCSFMWHEGSYGIQDRHSNVKHTVIQLERDADKWATIMATYSNKSKDFWLKNGVGKDLFLSPDQCIELGIVDKLF
jgi:ATP-dependent protease ClpP protease subunit